MPDLVAPGLNVKGCSTASSACVVLIKSAKVIPSSYVKKAASASAKTVFKWHAGNKAQLLCPSPKHSTI